MCKSIYEWKTNAYLNFLPRKKKLKINLTKKYLKQKADINKNLYLQNKTKQKMMHCIILTIAERAAA